MAGEGSKDLEARVARLERLLDGVLAQLAGRPTDLEEGASPREAEVSPAAASPPAAAPTSAPRSGRASERSHEPPRSRRPRAFPPEGLGSLVMRGSFLARVGIVLLLLSVAFFFKYSVDQGWLVPAVRLAIGFLLGVALLAMGFRGAGRGEYLGTTLAGGGIATLFITGFTGHQWYSIVAYPAAFGLLVVASALGMFLSLRSGRQALALVGLIGALATPLLLTPPTARLGGLVFYVCLVVATVAAVYWIQTWRALLLTAVAASWLVLSLAVSRDPLESGVSLWVLQAGIGFCGLIFWFVPVLRDAVGGRGRGGAGPSGDGSGAVPRGRRHESGPDSPPEAEDLEEGLTLADELQDVPWHVHLDGLSLVMPLVAIGFSAWLWNLSKLDLGWLFLGGSVLAQGFGVLLSRLEDSQGLARTQGTVAILLGTVGIALVLTGNLLYTALIAEATVLGVVGAARGSRVLEALGASVQLLVAAMFVGRIMGGLDGGETLYSGDPSALLDLAALGAAVFVGTRFRKEQWRNGYFIAAYVAFLAFLGREFYQHHALLYLSLVAIAVASHVLAKRGDLPVLRDLGHLAGFLALLFLVAGFQANRTLIGGEVMSLLDLVALAGMAYVGTLLRARETRLLLLWGAYLLTLAWTVRELFPLQGGQGWTSLALGAEGAALLAAGSVLRRPMAQKGGLATLLLVVVKLLLVDLSAVEPIWRVLLFSVFGGLFLLLSRFIRFKDADVAAEPAEPDLMGLDSATTPGSPGP